MPVSALVATAGSATANTYCTLAVANQYHLDRPAAGTVWSAATDDQKNSGLLFATVLLDRLFYWNGYVVNEIQNLLWPRMGLYEVNRISALDYTTIPQLIQWATAEFSRQLIAEDRTGDSDVQTQGIKLIKVGSVRIDFKDAVFAKPIPDIVTNLIPEEWGYVLQNEKINIRELRRA